MNVFYYSQARIIPITFGFRPEDILAMVDGKQLVTDVFHLFFPSLEQHTSMNVQPWAFSPLICVYLSTLTKHDYNIFLIPTNNF